MSFVITKTLLAAAVPNDGTFSIAYPAGTSGTSDWANDHIVITNRNNIWPIADGWFSVSFDASFITITNTTGQPLAAGTLVQLQADLADEVPLSEARFATADEAEAGTKTDVVMSPARVKQGVYAAQPFVDARALGVSGDGGTDDKAAFDAAESNGVSPVWLADGTYRISAGHAQTVSYELSSAATVTPDSGGWNPRRYFKHGATPYARKVNPSGSNPSVPVEDYTVLEDAPNLHDQWINQWGYQEADTDGNLSGASTAGKIPTGQSRLARTQSAQTRWQGSHSGEGDAYNFYGTMTVTQHGRAGVVTAWGGQNSAGLGNGQVNATSAQVNLYGLGDIVLGDGGFSDVSMLGAVMILDRDGADAAAYSVPRFAYMALSQGTQDADCGYIIKGNFYSGIDFSDATLSSNFALTLAAGQRIGFDATVPPTGKFSSQAPGGYWIEKSGSFLSFVAGNHSSLNVYSDRTEVRPGTEGGFAHRVYGSSSTAFAATGQIGATSYFSAASTGSDNTTLALRTANAGTESDRLVIDTNGHARPGTDATYDLGTDTHAWRNLKVAGTEVDFTGLPTSDPGVAGRLWNDSGTVKVSAG